METTATECERHFLKPLILGGVLQALPVLFSGNAAVTTVSSLLWPFFFLLSFRRADTRRRYLWCMAVLVVSKFLRNMLMYGPRPRYFLVVLALCLIISFAEGIAFTVDRRISRKDSPFSSLYFPVLFTAAHCLIIALNIGNLTDPGAAIAHLPVFAQSANLLLEHGLCFILTWISSMLAFAKDGIKKRRIVCLSVSVILIVLMLGFGLVRLSGKKTPDGQIRVALCTSFEAAFDSIASERSGEDYLRLIGSELDEAVRNGAEFAVFVEEHTCFKADELFADLGEVSALVKRAGMPVLLPIEVSIPGAAKNINEAVLFDKNGEPVLTYIKNNLVPIVESPYYEKGSDHIGQATVDIGGQSYKLAVAICFDCNDASLVHETDPDTELLVCPCWEWFSCNREQPRTACLRAIENDVTLIKATQDGYHIVTDPYGSIVFSENTEGSYESVTVTDVPVYRKGENTSLMFLPSLNATSACELSSSVMLLIIFVAMCFQLQNSDRKSRIYVVCVLLTLLGLLFDAFSYIFDGSPWSDGLCFFVNLCSYMFVDIIMIAFAMYFHALLTERRGSLLRLAYASMLIPFLDILFLIFSAATKKLFIINEGIFTAGPWDTYSGIAPAASILFVLIIAVVNRKKLNVREYSAIILYMVLPLAASFIVAFLGGVGSLSYVAVSLSMLILFVLIQAGTIEESSIREKVLREVSLLDQLTSLSNRRAFDARLAEYNDFAPFAAIFCDLNGLKETNDTYGHAAGDELLLRFAEMLKQHFDRQDIFRISGDEFVILPSDPAPESVERVVDKFKKDIALRDGIAAVGWAFGAGAEKQEIVKLAESRMYADKRRFHGQKEESNE